MAIQSMTGFAREAGTTGPLSWAWELKSVNGRGLEVRLRVPPGFDSAGEDARRQIAGAFSRGQCQLSLTVSRASSTPRVSVNREALEALITALGSLKLPDEVRPASLDGLLAVRGIVEIEDEAADPAAGDALRGDLTAAAGRLVEALKVARAGEGLALQRVIEGQLSEISRLVDAAEACPGRHPDAIRAKLAEQVAALMGAAGSLDPARLHQEAALLATRADIREEIDRLQAHVAAARELLAAKGSVGRRLDFLAQEFGREANTLCSKANDVSLSRIGLELKAVVEQFREQVQNVE
ncbi:MAG: YicC family protein [Enterovirga sp.]|jgi:uncharacterized protein (TIGR00255 family)|nr:YicC family protein [Enterovirga sp.]